MIKIALKKQQSKFLPTCVGMLSLLLLATISLPVKANSTAVVTAPVTIQNVSVSVSDGSVSYGTLGTSSSKDTTSSGLNDSQTATNNGNVSQDLNIRGENTTDWTLSTTVGADQYKHDFCVTTCDTSPTWTALTTNSQTLSSGVAASGTQVFDLRLNTPSSSTSFDQQSANVTILATASS